MENDAIKARDKRKHLETTRGIKCEHSSSGAYTKPLRDEQHYITPKCRLESLKQSSEQFARSGQASTTVNMFCASICLWRPHDAPENDKQMHSRRVDALHELSMKRLGKSRPCICMSEFSHSTSYELYERACKQAFLSSSSRQKRELVFSLDGLSSWRQKSKCACTSTATLFPLMSVS